jgi:hypothetical protein
MDKKYGGWCKFALKRAVTGLVLQVQCVCVWGGGSSLVASVTCSGRNLPCFQDGA